jgi:dCTP deaminase
MIRRRGLLVDRDIRAAVRRGELVVGDFDDAMVRPAAISLRLGNAAYVLTSEAVFDPTDVKTYPGHEQRGVDERGVIVLHPGEVMLARTQERIGLGNRLAGIVDGTSDWARLGVSVVLSQQVSPGYGMPFGTPLTLEIVSRLGHDVLLRPGTRIANLMLLRGRRVRRSYGDMPANHSQPEWSFRSRLSEAEDLRSVS